MTVEEVIGAILFVIVLGGIGYWMFKTDRGPFDDD